MKTRRRLGEMKKDESGTIASTGGSPEMNRRLLGMGFLEGSRVEVLHEAPFGRDPIAVRVRGSVVALRRSEANLIEVES